MTKTYRRMPFPVEALRITPHMLDGTEHWPEGFFPAKVITDNWYPGDFLVRSARDGGHGPWVHTNPTRFLEEYELHEPATVTPLRIVK